MDYRSRFTTKPFLNEKGRPRVVKEDAILRYLKALAPYPFLTAPWIAALTDSSAEYVTKFFKVAKCEPNSYVRIADFQRESPAQHLSTHLVWQPADRGEALLRHYGIETSKDEYSGQKEHRLMSCQCRASFDLGLRPPVSIIPWNVISEGQISQHIPIGGRNVARFDCAPFIVQFGTGDARRRIYFTGIEADRDTESFTVIKNRYKDHIKILAEKTYRTHLSFPRITIPWITTNALRMQGLMRLWLEMTKGTPHTKSAIFKVFKNEPTGWAIADPWHLADGATFTFSEGGGNR